MAVHRMVYLHPVKTDGNQGQPEDPFPITFGAIKISRRGAADVEGKPTAHWTLNPVLVSRIILPDSSWFP